MQTQESVKRNKRDNLRTILFVCLIGLLCIAIILISAYTADAQYNLNKINSRQDAIRSEIADVSARLGNVTNITVIEAKAMALGMIYPSYSEKISLVAGERDKTDLAAEIRMAALRTE